MYKTVKRAPAKLVILLMLGLSATVFGQAKEFHLGFGGGPNFVYQEVKPNNNLDFTVRVTGAIGMVLIYHFTDHIALQLEPMLTSRGTNVDSAGFNYLHYNFNYLDFPLTLRYSPMSSKIKPYFLGGLYVAFLRSAAIKDNLDTELTLVNEFGTPISFKENTRDNDIGAVFGLGVNFPVGNNHIFVEFYGSFGFPDIDEINSSTNFTVKNRGFHFRTGMSFPLPVRPGLKKSPENSRSL